jgi:integrase
MDKPRVTYAQVFGMKYEKGSIGDLIERFVKEMDGGVRPLGYTHRYTLKRLQHAPIAKKLAADLTKSDVIDHCRERRKTVCGATTMQDVASLVGVLKYAGAAWNDCDKISDAIIKAAKPFLTKHNLIGKSTPRTRRPMADEKVALEAHFAAQNAHARTVVDMVKVSRWQHASSRRISESCALLWPDWRPEHQTILVRKMKDPKNRAKSKVVALPSDAQALLYEWAHEIDAKPELRTDEPRILPYNSHTCSARYTLAKKALGIVGLRLHDDRRDRGSRLIEEEGYSAEEAIQFTGTTTRRCSSALT